MKRGRGKEKFEISVYTHIYNMGRSFIVIYRTIQYNKRLQDW